MKYLIVTADDLGLTGSINNGIAESVKDGIVTAVALIPSGEAFGQAVEIARDLKFSAIAAHLSLTEGSPVSDPKSVSSIVTSDGRFYPGYGRLFSAFLFNKIDPKHIYTELKSQMDALKKTGLKVSYLTSHQHIHMMPGMLEVFLAIAREYGIPAMRPTHKDKIVMPISVAKIYKSMVLSALSGNMHPDAFMGFLDGGSISEDTLIGLLKSLREGVTEIACHPGFMGAEILARHRFHMGCEEELSALASPKVRKVIQDLGIKLIGYEEFLKI
jgi:predicted glycoside hydrolase/deacetylase ChbG (UPF0249 family)